ncbi:UvrD-helicase domain-containing protein [Syntrophomonas palmitatica]|uniref:UvrD-helicase domain-containing protein n=1 Tax=Syntrophomonas palmitatica TaxID=402877 RepID=UPI0006CFEF3C|nr:UvrD-helicase domain-containing protein [Syntrophomonas palmitatica]
MGWTDEQREAIQNRSCNLLVSAAAGSGKTAVLVERIINLLVEDKNEDKLDIDRMLVVTFTQAAAGEMRERISAAIIAELAKGNSDEQHLRRQLMLLGRASISTIHAFCTEVLRTYFYLVNLDPQFRIADAPKVSY